MSFNNDFFKDFDRDFKKTQRRIFGLAAIGAALYVAFWTAVLVVVVLVLKHVGWL